MALVIFFGQTFVILQTDEEFYATMSGMDVFVHINKSVVKDSAVEETLSGSVDWRDRGYVTPVKFQVLDIIRFFFNPAHIQATAKKLQQQHVD